MMDQVQYQVYLDTLLHELIPATGCTEPIAIAYTAALCRDALGKMPETSKISVSGSILKNVKSVVVPATGGLKGIDTAAAAGFVAGRAENRLEVLQQAPEDTGERVAAYLSQHPIEVLLSDSGYIFDIDLTCFSGNDTAEVRIVGHHTNVVLIRRNKDILYQAEIGCAEPAEISEEQLNIDGVFEFAVSCDIQDVEGVIQRQIDCNTALSQEGLTHPWGACIGQILYASSGVPDVQLVAKARAAAGSDARMSGCEKPAVINSGSGNQGITITLPIVTYAEHLGASHEDLIRALVLANLCSIRIKSAIGCLSAYCGAVCAGCAAGAGIAFLYGKDKSVIVHTIVNGLAILSGMICDGAKPSCAAKIAMSVEAGILAFKMASSGHEFFGGEGIVKKGIENTIREVGKLGRIGMAQTNDVILDIMMEKPDTGSIQKY